MQFFSFSFYATLFLWGKNSRNLNLNHYTYVPNSYQFTVREMEIRESSSKNAEKDKC